MPLPIERSLVDDLTNRRLSPRRRQKIGVLQAQVSEHDLQMPQICLVPDLLPAPCQNAIQHHSLLT